MHTVHKLMLILQVLKYNEPPEARKPNKSWRLYVFKGKEQLGSFCFISFPYTNLRFDGKFSDMFHINRQSCYLLGRDRLVWWQLLSPWESAI